MKPHLIIAACLAACGTAAIVGKPAVYGTALEECNRTAQTLCESIACEDRVRAAAGRPTLPPPSSCLPDGGTK